MATQGNTLKPPRLEVLPDSPDAARIFKHWLFILEGIITALPADSTQNTLIILATSISHEIYEIIQDATNYTTALEKLKSTYIKPQIEIISRFKLQNMRQNANEKISDYLIRLEAQSLQCGFKDVKAEEYRKEMIRDAFVSGLNSSPIRTRLLENTTLTLDQATNQARAMEVAIHDSSSFGSVSTVSHSLGAVSLSTNAPKAWVCFFCGSKTRHRRDACPAKESTCRGCKRIGHFSTVCCSTPANSSRQPTRTEQLATIGPQGPRNFNSTTEAEVNGSPCRSLLDTGAENNFLDEDFALQNSVNILPYETFITLA